VADAAAAAATAAACTACAVAAVVAANGLGVRVDGSRGSSSSL